MKIALIVFTLLSCFEVETNGRQYPWIRSLFCAVSFILACVLFLMEK